MTPDTDTLPSGSVSFCFTDIEESTKLFGRLGERYEELLDDHRRLIREAAGMFGGVEIKTEGDGCFLAFSDAVAAIKAAGAMQHAVDQHDWPENASIRIRVGVHTGNAEPSGKDYVSLAVHQAARVSEAAHGGQVVVSAQTVAEIGHKSLAPFHLADLGEYRLRSFDQPCRLYQLAGPGLAGAFPPLRVRAAMRKRLRIFLSSPGDVRAVREIAALTIERLAQDYARFFRIEPYFWDYEAMIASGQFQDTVEPPSAFDIVVCVLWSRLGALLPESTSVREYRGIDGRVPLTGTEWVYEEALQAARERGAPDLLVYRSCAPVLVDSRDVTRRQQGIEDLRAVDHFWSQNFTNQQASVGFHGEFVSDSQFAEDLEKQLRPLIEKGISAEGVGDADQAVKIWMQAPFRGLESYEFEHAPIFFGQDEALTKAMVQLLANAASGTPFLLVQGASGSGKSSLVKAGIVPKLFVPRRVTGAAFLRRVIFHPSDAQQDEDLFDALARKLVTQVSDQEGLSELIGPGQSVSSLASHFRNAATAPGYPIGTALGQLAALARREGKMLDCEAARLVLVVDQLEELFTNERITPAERNSFVDLLSALVHSGYVWVIATMRNDFWHRAVETPNLVRLVEGSGRLELMPPTPSQVSQIIRRPAAAAGVNFEIHHTTRVPLDEVIAEDVVREPGALPLLSYLLDQLYRSDVLEAFGSTLTFATYEKLGRLEGAIATKAEAVLDNCAIEDRQSLGSVLFSLVQMSASDGAIERAISRRVPLSTFPVGTSQRRLVDALLSPQARLLVSDAEPGGGKPTVRVAHEALITRWAKARDFVQGNAEALKIRRRIEERYALWRGSQDAPNDKSHASIPLRTRLATWRSRFGHEKGLLTEIDLADGQRLLREHRSDTEPHLLAFIERSATEDKRIHSRSVRVLASVAGVVTVLAILALLARNEAVSAGNEARAQRTQAEGLVEFMLGDLRAKLEPKASLGVLDAVGRRAMQYYTQQGQSGLDADALGRRARVLHMLGEIADQRGDLASALNLFQQASASTAELLARNPNNIQRIFEQAQSVFWVGEIASRRGQLPVAETKFREYRRLAGELVDKGGPKDEWLAEVGYANLDLATVLLNEHRVEPALVSLQQALAIKEELARRSPKDRDRRLDVAQGLAWLSDAELQSGALDVAMQNRRAEQTIYMRLLVETPDDRPTIEALVVNRDKIAQILLVNGQIDEAMTELKKAVAESQPLLASDPANVGYRGAALGAFLLQGESHLQAHELEQAEIAASRAQTLVDGLVKSAPTVIEWSGIQLGSVRLLKVRIAAARARDMEACRAALAPAVLESERLDGLSASVPRLLPLVRVAAQGDLLRGDFESVSARPDLARAAWARAVANINRVAGIGNEVSDRTFQHLLSYAQSHLQQAPPQGEMKRMVGRQFDCKTI